jgi:hypothetical protein
VDGGGVAGAADALNVPAVPDALAVPDEPDVPDAELKSEADAATSIMANPWSGVVRAAGHGRRRTRIKCVFKYLPGHLLPRQSLGRGTASRFEDGRGYILDAIAIRMV